MLRRWAHPQSLTDCNFAALGLTEAYALQYIHLWKDIKLIKNVLLGQETDRIFEFKLLLSQRDPIFLIIIY